MKLNISGTLTTETTREIKVRDAFLHDSAWFAQNIVTTRDTGVRVWDISFADGGYPLYDKRGRVMERTTGKRLLVVVETVRRTIGVGK